MLNLMKERERREGGEREGERERKRQKEGEMEEGESHSLDNQMWNFAFSGINYFLEIVKINETTDKFK